MQTNKKKLWLKKKVKEHEQKWLRKLKSEKKYKH